MGERMRTVLGLASPAPCAFLLAAAACALVVGAARGQTAGPGSSILAFAPPVLTVPQGGSAVARVMVSLRAGQAGATAIMAWDAPPGMAVSFSPASGTPAFNAVMNVTVAPNVKPGAYTVKVQATGADPSGVAAYVITVERSSGY